MSMFEVQNVGLPERSLENKIVTIRSKDARIRFDSPQSSKRRSYVRRVQARHFFARSQFAPTD